MPARAALFEAGESWFATSADGQWTVTVTASDRDTAVEVSASLQPYWHLFRRAIPLAPVNEEEIGRSAYQGGEVLITFGEQRCQGNCQSPEGWFYVYRVTGDGLEQYAHYPGWSGCVLVEEDEFALAVAPERGRIEIRRSDTAVVIEEDDSQPFAFVDKAGEAFTIHMWDEDGSVPVCVEQMRGDSRGGIEPFPGSDEQPPAPESSRVIEIGECQTTPFYLTDYTDEDPLRLACVETNFGQVGLAQLVPNEMMADPPRDLECLMELYGTGAAATCSKVGSDTVEPLFGGEEEFRSFTTVAPAGTTRIVATTTGGTQLEAQPFDGLVYVWWLPTEGELHEVIAETASGIVTVYTRPLP